MEEEWILAIPNGRTTKNENRKKNRSNFLIEDLFPLLVQANSKFKVNSGQKLKETTHFVHKQVQ